MVSDSSEEMVTAVALRILPPIALLILVYHVLGRLEEYWRLRHFKGPATTGISWWWHSKAVISGKSHQFYGDVTEKYGMRDIPRIILVLEVYLLLTVQRADRASGTESPHH
jgi:hypothetical protein